MKGIAVCSWDVLSITPNICQAAAISEGIFADAGHAVPDGDGGQAAAFIEGIAADAGHAVWDDDGGQAAAFIESIFADAGHAVCCAIISDRTWNNDSTRIIRIIYVVLIFLIRHRCFVSREVVVDAVNLGIVGACHHRQHGQKD